MKRIFNIFYIISITAILIGCYGISGEDFPELASLEITYPSQEVNVKQLVPLDLQLDVVNKSDKPVSYEWCMGLINGTFPAMVDTTFISSEKNVNYAFSKPGEYVLRLKADNGEKIVFKYFRLRVQTGFDKGYLILSNDPSTKVGSLTFIKKRSDQEITDNEQEIWPDIFSTINDGEKLYSGTDIYLSQYETFSSLLIACSDDKGSVYKLNPQTMVLVNVNNVAEEYAGAKILKFAGEYTASADYYCYATATDGKAYRYDMYNNLVGAKDASNNYYKSIYQGYDGSKRVNFFYSSEAVYVPGRTPLKAPEGFKLLNLAYTRSVPAGGYLKLNVIYQSDSEPTKFTTQNTSTSLGSPKYGIQNQDLGNVAMDYNSIMISTGANNYAYYNYNNKIYRWDVTNITSINFTLPTESQYQRRPDGSSMIPEGEQILAMCNNNNPYDKSIVDKYLVVATYNPNRSTAKKGSLYVFDLTDNSLVNSWEGVCDKPSSVIFKF